MSKYLILFLLIINSCSSNQDKTFKDQVSEDLVTTFDIKTDNYEKFKIVETAKAKPKKFKKAKPSVSKEKKLPEVKKVQKKKSEYPEDYPKEFIGYDDKSKLFWNKFQPVLFTGEEFVFEVSFMGITAGYIKMETLPIVDIAGDKAFHFKAHMRSAQFYKYIYTLDDSIESFISTKNFLPIKYTLIQRESGQSVDDLQLFDAEKLKTYFWYKKLKNGVLKKRELKKYIPKYFQDGYSALYFVRGFPLDIGDVYEFPIVTRAKIWIIKIKADRHEEIKIRGKWVKAIKVKAETRFPGVLKKKGDIVFWYSLDKTRRLLKFEAKVKIGSITGELVDYSNGSK